MSMPGYREQYPEEQWFDDDDIDYDSPEFANLYPPDGPFDPFGFGPDAWVLVGGEWMPDPIFLDFIADGLDYE